MIYTARDINVIRFCSEKRKMVFPLPKCPIPYCDLTYCVDGEMTYVYEDVEYTLHANDAIFFPQGCVRERRIETAESLLITTNLSLSEVAEHCGFEDYNYFSRIFKRQVGISAMRYRKINRDTF